MGMYTEIIVKADVKESIPSEVKEVLNYLFNNADLPITLPNHEFFTKPRWDRIGHCCSYYHIPWTDSKYSENRIFSRSDIKNYDGEIEAFWDWIKPFLDEIEGKCIGWEWYEEFDSPTLVYK